MLGCERANIMRLAVVVPGDNLEELRLQSKDFVPTIKPESVTWEDPVLAIRHLRTVMGAEPGRDGCVIVS
jgi:hypothetical protein